MTTNFLHSNASLGGKPVVNLSGAPSRGARAKQQWLGEGASACHRTEPAGWGFELCSELLRRDVKSFGHVSLKVPTKPGDSLSPRNVISVHKASLRGFMSYNQGLGKNSCWHKLAPTFYLPSFALCIHGNSFYPFGFVEVTGGVIRYQCQLPHRQRYRASAADKSAA